MNRLTAKIAIAAAFLVFFGAVAGKTIADLRPLPDTLTPDPNDIRKVQVRDRRGVPLSVTYRNNWNYADHVPLHEIPPLLQKAFVTAEDKRFYQHHGGDWLGRLNAIRQNAAAGRGVRGASTITEQVVRLIHPRPRTLWSRWLEGIEASRLERRFRKDAILEFYLNQVPYSGLRRGVVQAARYYFDRDLDTLNGAEMLALAVLVRAPGRMDIHRGTDQIGKPLRVLAQQLRANGALTEQEYRAVSAEEVGVSKPALEVQADHFVRYVQAQNIAPRLLQNGRLLTTLDSSVQESARKLLDRRLVDLRKRNVRNGAVLVVDHTNGEIIAWVNSGGNGDAEGSGAMIDAVLTPRQPGSTLKPFVYLLALERGWTAATLIDDSPLARAVGTGLHDYRNYSRQNYGPLRLRECLGNSLNIPAVRTVQQLGVPDLLKRLHELGFGSLSRPADFYGEGLALGNGEVTLLELVRAYAVLARGGEVRRLSAVMGEKPDSAQVTRVLGEENASIIANILADPEARRLEFGSGSLLRFPTQTAVKTGTSTDYRDAWSIGFNHRYAIGVWMGNLDGKSMDGVTGSIGPALVLRSLFAELGRYDESRPLFLSPRLAQRRICQKSGALPREGCPTMMEWFAPGMVPRETCRGHGRGGDSSVAASPVAKVALVQPTPGLQLAMDPRIPDELEAFPLGLPKSLPTKKVEWLVDGTVIGTTGEGETRILWRLARGTHVAAARVWLKDRTAPEEAPGVRFTVK